MPTIPFLLFLILLYVLIYFTFGMRF